MLQLLFVLPSLFPGCTSIGVVTQEERPAALETARTTGWIPFELFRERWVFLRGLVNGVETEMVLDSGAGITVIDQAEARRRGLRGGRRISAQGVGGFQQARIHRGVFIELDGLSLPNLSVAAVDLSEVGRHIGRPLPLILGREVFDRVVVDLDYPHRRVAFRDFDEAMPEDAGTLVPLTPVAGGKWAVELEVAEAGRGLFLVDTGAGETLTLFEDFVRGVPLLARLPTSVHVTGGVGGMLEVRSGTLPSVTFAGVTLRDVPASFHVGEQGLFSDLDLAGNLGAGILARYRLIFLTRRGELWARPGPDAVTRPFERDRTGLQTVWTGESLEVVHVAPGSPAAATGWQVGARIVAVNGVAVGADYWNELQGWNWAEPGTRVRLRDADGVEHELVLENYF